MSEIDLGRAAEKKERKGRRKDRGGRIEGASLTPGQTWTASMYLHWHTHTHRQRASDRYEALALAPFSFFLLGLSAQIWATSNKQPNPKRSTIPKYLYTRELTRQKQHQQPSLTGQTRLAELSVKRVCLCVCVCSFVIGHRNNSWSERVSKGTEVRRTGMKEVILTGTLFLFSPPVSSSLHHSFTQTHT